MRQLLALLVFFIMSTVEADENDPCRLFNICPNGPVVDGVSYFDQLQCEGLFESYPYTLSPFVNGVCQRYHTIKQQTRIHNRIFFVKKESQLAAVASNYYALVFLDENPRFEFYIDYGVANALEVSELARIHQQHRLTHNKPYNGEPLQALSVDMLAEFEVIAVDERHQRINFNTTSGVEFFKSIEVVPFKEQGFAYVSIGLTPLGHSVISQSLAGDIPLYGLFSWRANHTFGDLTLSANGDLGCVHTRNVGEMTKLVPCI